VTGLFGQLRAGLAVFALVLSSLALAPSSASAAVIDVSKSEAVGIVNCPSATALDCVESLGFLDSTNTYVPAQLAGVYRSPNARIGQNGNAYHDGSTTWTASVDGATRTVTLNSELQSPNFVLFKSPTGDIHYGASLRPIIFGQDLEKIKVRFVIRTSYLRPQNVQLVADEADFKQTSIPGGNAWTFEGKGTAVSTYTKDWEQADKRNFLAKADLDTTELHFIIHHADKDLTRGYWPAPCADKGYSVQAFNSNSAGEPSWNPRTQSLDSNVPAPHQRANGDDTVGFFKLWTFDAYMNCQWKNNTLASANNIAVEIVNKDSTVQTATSRVLHAKGRLYVEVSGFHYSAPTIKIKALKTSIVCVYTKNAKLKKTVSGVAPKCPAGYVKK
jgi:hypothetical protein